MISFADTAPLPGMPKFPQGFTQQGVLPGFPGANFAQFRPEFTVPGQQQLAAAAAAIQQAVAAASAGAASGSGFPAKR